MNKLKKVELAKHKAESICNFFVKGCKKDSSNIQQINFAKKLNMEKHDGNLFGRIRAVFLGKFGSENRLEKWKKLELLAFWIFQVSMKKSKWGDFSIQESSNKNKSLPPPSQILMEDFKAAVPEKYELEYRDMIIE